MLAGNSKAIAEVQSELSDKDMKIQQLEEKVEELESVKAKNAAMKSRLDRIESMLRAPASK